MLPAGELYPAARAQVFLAKHGYRQQRYHRCSIKPVGIFQEYLIVDEAHCQHDNQAAHDPINLADMCAGKLCSVSCAVNFQHAKRAYDEDKSEQEPVKIA